MMLNLYVALEIFLLIAVRNPSAHRSLIAFAAWSGFAHAVAMSILGLEIASQRVGFLIGSAVLVVIGVALIALAPAKESGERASAALPIDIQPRPTDLPAFELGPSHAGPNSFHDQRPFEFGDCADDHDDRPPKCSLGIDCFTLGKELDTKSIRHRPGIQIHSLLI